MTTIAASEILLGRQPIYDRGRNIVAYELLYRKGTDTTAVIDDPDAATARVLVNLITEIGLDEACGSRPVFVNCTRHFLETRPILPPDRCVLEILETVAVDDALVQAVHRLIKDGYRVALDDFVYAKRWEPLLDLVHYVKVDLRLHTREELRETVHRLSAHSAVLLAEKVESEEELQFCRKLGFQLFQGYFLRRPETISARSVPSSLFGLLHLSECLRDPNSDFAEIAESIEQDMTLSYRLLRLVNSAMMPSREPIESIRHAVAVAGTDLLARWVALLGLLRIESCPGDYIEIALQRARACEVISSEEGLAIPEQAYTVGLLSLLDSMLGSPWRSLISSLPLRAEMVRALSDREGDLGRILLAVELYEAGTPPEKEASFLSLAKGFWEGAAYSRKTMLALRQFAD